MSDHGDDLGRQPAARKSLLEVLEMLTPLEEEFSAIEELPPEPLDL